MLQAWWPERNEDLVASCLSAGHGSLEFLLLFFLLWIRLVSFQRAGPSLHKESTSQGPKGCEARQLLKGPAHHFPGEHQEASKLRKRRAGKGLAECFKLVLLRPVFTDFFKATPGGFPGSVARGHELQSRASETSPRSSGDGWDGSTEWSSYVSLDLSAGMPCTESLSATKAGSTLLMTSRHVSSPKDGGQQGS